MSSREWFYYANEQVQGPVTEEQLKSLIASGAVRPDTLVCENTQDASARSWIKASEVKPTMSTSPRHTHPEPLSVPPRKNKILLSFVCLFFMLMALLFNYNLMRIGSSLSYIESALHDIDGRLFNLEIELPHISVELSGVRRALY